MAKILVVVDMQKDFIDGALSNAEAQQIIPYVKRKIDEAKERKDIIIFTRDTHQNDYMETEEGKNLPVPHCVVGTEGWEILPELNPKENATAIFDKETFGSKDLADFLKSNQRLMRVFDEKDITLFGEIEFIGVCTDICVISNVLLAKAFAPNTRIKVAAAGCAGVTPEAHDTALSAMKACHVHVVNEGEEAWR